MRSSAKFVMKRAWLVAQAGPGGNSGAGGWCVLNSYSPGGGVVGNNQFTLNGANITNQFGYDNHSLGEWTVSLNIDSIQEVNVMTTSYDARFGRTSGGIVNIVSKAGATLGRRFSTANDPFPCWVGLPPHGLQPINSTTAQVRNPTMPNMDVSLQMSTALTSRLTFDLRLDAFNTTNSVLFGGPDTNPGEGAASCNESSGWHGCGTVGAYQKNFPRILQVSRKISF